MSDLLEQLRDSLRGRVCLIGLGNVEYRDDGFGVRLAEEVQNRGVQDVFVAGTSPESFVSTVESGNFDAVLFVDAVDFGGEPGAVVLLNSSKISARFPQISTHKLSIGLLATLFETRGTKTFLLGVQPESLAGGTQLSSTISTTLRAVAEIICDELFARNVSGSSATASAVSL